MTGEEIENRVSYHKPSKDGADRHESLSSSAGRFMGVVEITCPDGREKSLALTKIEEAKFWASAAVARNPETR